MLYLYFTWLSQPARAILALFTIESKKIGPWEVVKVDLTKAEHVRNLELKKQLPLGKIPGIKETFDDGRADFNLVESHAILKYLCYARDLPEHWYPRRPENL